MKQSGLKRVGILAAAACLAGAGEAQPPASASHDAWQAFLQRNAGERFALLDADNDGGVTREEFRAFLHQVFDPERKGLAPNQEAILLTAFEMTDTDYDGVIDRTEYRASSLARTKPALEVRPPLALHEGAEALQFPPTEPYDTLPRLDLPTQPGEPDDPPGPGPEEDIPRTGEEGGGG